MPERLGAAEAAATARLLWNLFEPVHVVSYFAAEPRAAFGQADAVAALRRLLAAAAALPFRSGRPAGADGQLITHPGPEPS